MGTCHQEAMTKYSQVDGKTFNPRKCCQIFFFLPLEFSDEKENVSATLIGWIVLYHMFPVFDKIDHSNFRFHNPEVSAIFSRPQKGISHQPTSVPVFYHKVGLKSKKILITLPFFCFFNFWFPGENNEDILLRN